MVFIAKLRRRFEIYRLRRRFFIRTGMYRNNINVLKRRLSILTYGTDRYAKFKNICSQCGDSVIDDGKHKDRRIYCAECRANLKIATPSEIDRASKEVRALGEPEPTKKHENRSDIIRKFNERQSIRDREGREDVIKTE